MRNTLSYRSCNIADKKTDEAMEQLSIAIGIAEEMPFISEVLIDHVTDANQLKRSLFTLSQVEKMLLANVESERKALLALLQAQGGENE